MNKSDHDNDRPFNPNEEFGRFATDLLKEIFHDLDLLKDDAVIGEPFNALRSIAEIESKLSKVSYNVWSLWGQGSRYKRERDACEMELRGYKLAKLINLAAMDKNVDPSELDAATITAILKGLK